MYTDSAMGSRNDVITVYLDDRPVQVLRRMEVGDLCEELPEELREALAKGRAVVQDAQGNQVGSGGALAEGGRYFVVRKKKG